MRDAAIQLDHHGAFRVPRDDSPEWFAAAEIFVGLK